MHRWILALGALGALAVACSSGGGGGGSGGSAELGGSCQEDEDCADDPRGRVRCSEDFSADEPQPFCQLLAPQQEGEACSGDLMGSGFLVWNAGSNLEVPVCDNTMGLYCAYDVCAVPVKLGEACVGLPCEEGTYCDWPEEWCKAKRGLGEVCRVNKECTSNYCWEEKCQTRSW